MRTALTVPCLVALAACSPAGAPGRRPPDAAATVDAPDAARPPDPGPPTLAVGLDAYRMWDALALVRIGARTYMRSTYDRAGGNEAADASHFLRQERDDFNVSLDVEGSGFVYFVRTNHWHGSPWHYVVDGLDHVVTETSTADPDRPTPGSVFEPAAALPNPLTWTWSITRGADLNWVPIGFERAFTMAYGRTHYGTGYYIYQLFADGETRLSQPVRAWDGVTPPSADVLDLLRRAGTDIAPLGDGVSTREGAVDLPAEGVVPVVSLDGGPAVVRALRFTVARGRAIEFGRARLRVTWDDRAEPSIDAPLALFYGTGTLFNRDERECLVKGLLVNVCQDDRDVRLSVYLPMPFFQRARVELVGAGAAVAGVRWHVRTQPWGHPRAATGYLHATYVDHADPQPGRDLVLLDTTATEAGGDWCGAFVGTSFVFSERAALGTLEGDPRFFFDDSLSPQGQGTGTEEWGGGGDYWGGRTMTLPLAGHPVGAASPGSAVNAEDLIESAYRYLVADAMPFGRNARIQLEHGGENDSTERYRSVTYWYGRPGACLVPTDRLDVGDPADEARHRYSSPGALGVDTLTSRYELGVDTLRDGTVVLPPSTESGRHTTGTSEFTLALDPANRGALLRRTLDYGFRDQRAEVYVADDRDGAPFERAGVWYTAGSNQCVYSNPPTELGAPSQTLQTSNRRWRDDEFLLPSRLTAGRAAVRVRLTYAPVSRPIVPGATPADSAWSEYRYTAYSYVY
jgi:hypothetical protein